MAWVVEGRSGFSDDHGRTTDGNHQHGTGAADGLVVDVDSYDDRQTRLTPAEQYSLMTFFTIFRSPLFYGGDLPTMDDFTLKLLTNEEVLAMHRDGCKVREVLNDGKSVVIRSENAQTGEVYVAMFNLSDERTTVLAATDEIAVNGRKCIMDMWSGKKVGKVGKSLKSKLEPHASVLYKLY